MKVLLVYPNAHRELIGYMDLGAIAEPIALEYVAAGARLEGADVKLLDLRLHREGLEAAVRDFEPDVVGVTGYSMHVLRNLEICRRVKELRPQCKTVVGGHHATLEPVDFHEPEMDYVCVGAGIDSFRKILRQVPTGETTPVPGAWARVDGTFRYGGDPGQFDANTLPVPDRTCAPADRAGYFIDYMKPVALMRSSVGCPYRCTFCSLWRIMDGRYYTRELHEVVQELRDIPERHIHFSDDEPFVNPARMRQLADAIEKGGVDKEYYAYCRVDSFLRDRDLMTRWRDIGLRRLFFGIESVIERELRDYNKKTSFHQILEAMDTARDMGIGLFCGFIVNPNYEPEDFDELKRFIRVNEVSYPSFTIWTPIPGIQDGGTDYSAVNLRQPNGRPDWSKFDLQHATIPTKLPFEEFMRHYASLYEVSHYGTTAKRAVSAGELPVVDEVLADEARQRAQMIDAARRVLGN
jgi:radical SAM superfamily enzyme YgiQ (UPF0313 family)